MDDESLVKLLQGSKPDESPQKAQGVVIRKIFTITTVKVYPGGQIFIDESHSWLDKEGMQFKKKEKVKPKELEAAKIKSVENY
jgi:hypothetical protein